MWSWNHVALISCQVSLVCTSVPQPSAVQSEVPTGRDIRPGALLSGSRVRLSVKALPAWAHQLPGWNFTPGRAGQVLSGCVFAPVSQQPSSVLKDFAHEVITGLVLQVTLWCRPSGHQGSAAICLCCRTRGPAIAGARKASRCLQPNTWTWKMSMMKITIGR